MGEWKHELFGCLGNPTLSLMACLLCPLAVGKNAEAVGEKSAMIWTLTVQLMPCIAGPLLRGLIRKQQNIEGSFYFDFCAWLLCPCCAICQDTREAGSLDYLIAPQEQAVQRETSPPAAEAS